MLRPLGLCVLILSFVACDDGSVGVAPTNSLPITRVTVTPPVLEETSSAVAFSWEGEDVDGEVIGFEWKMTDNGPDGIADPEDILAEPWRFTTATDSVFWVSADMDSFPGDEYWQHRYWQTHTFFVRAVDDDGGRDPDPPDVNFTALSIAPSVTITEPASEASNSCQPVARNFRFRWSVWDADALEGDVLETRHLLIPLDELYDGCLTERQYRGSNLIRADDPRWSNWIPYDSGIPGATDLAHSADGVGERFLFAVQARDAAGAVSSTFRWHRNVLQVATAPMFPTLHVAKLTAVGDWGPYRMNVLPDPEFEIDWQGRAESYGGEITGYRYGWNVFDPSNPLDPGWAVPWGLGEEWKRTQFDLSSGTHILTVQCRDNSNALSSMQIIFSIVPAPALADQRPLLLVDDWPELLGPDALDEAWDEQWEALLDGRVYGFDPAADVIEAGVEPHRLLLENIVRYRGIIWFGNGNSFSYLRSHMEGLDANPLGTSHLEFYQRKIGNLFLVGPGVGNSSLSQSPLDGWVYPIVFDTPSLPPLGFGTGLYGGNPEPLILGTLEWMYRSWCVNPLDRCCPAVGFVYGGHDRAGVKLRDRNCDSLYRAVLSDEFRNAYPGAQYSPHYLSDLIPGPERKDQNSLYGSAMEEFYNWNATERVVSEPRPCQMAMFGWISRRDNDEYHLLDWHEEIPSLIPDEESDCPSWSTDVTPFYKAPTGILSSVYSDQKRIRGSHDFLWGFHPLSFEPDGVQAAIDWILGEDWQLTLE